MEYMYTHACMQVASLLSRIPGGEYSPTFHETVASMLRMDPLERPTASQLLETSPFAVADSIRDLASYVERLPWLAPLRTEGLTWEQVSGGAHVVRLCEIGTAETGTAELAASKLLELVAQVPGNQGFPSAYRVQKTVLCHCRARENTLAAKVTLPAAAFPPHE